MQFFSMVKQECRVTIMIITDKDLPVIQNHYHHDHRNDDHDRDDHHTIIMITIIINRPGVAGAVLQTPPSLIN